MKRDHLQPLRQEPRGFDEPSNSGTALEDGPPNGAHAPDRPRPPRSWRRPRLSPRDLSGAQYDIRDGRLWGGPLFRDTFYRRALAAADVVSATLALLIGVELVGHDQLSAIAVAAIPFVILVSKAAGLYDRDEHVLRKTTLDEAPALLRVATLYALVIYLGKDVLVTDGPVTYEQVIGLWGILFVSMLVCRAAARQIARTLTKPERCLVLGDALAASLVGNKVAKSHAVKAEMIGFVPLEPSEEAQGDPHRLGALDELDGIVREHRVDRVIIAPRSADSERLLGAIRLAKSLGVRVSVLPRLFEVVGSSVEFDDVDGVILLGVRSYGLTRSSQTLKRGLDLVGASIGLFVLAPLLAMITVAIRLNTPGPAFFRQPRVGRDDSHFEMLKFRTMVTGADEQKAELLARNEAEGLFKIADDPRMTPVGRFLRRTSLDELPQLVNVLKGDMSLVGPRPLVIEEDRRVEGWHRRRLALTPGMTGLWQILGPTRIPLHEMVKIDYLYGANWSLWLDIKILLRTVPHVLARRGL